jgi:hypothetical protein
LFFSSFAYLSVDHAEYGLFQPDHFHPPFIIDCAMPDPRYKQNFNIFYKGYSSGDYAVLYDALSTHDWSSLYNEISVNAAVDRVDVAVTQAVDLALPSGYIKMHKYPARFTGKLNAYIKRTIIFIDVTRSIRLFYDRFSFYRH